MVIAQRRAAEEGSPTAAPPQTNMFPPNLGKGAGAHAANRPVMADHGPKPRKGRRCIPSPVVVPDGDPRVQGVADTDGFQGVTDLEETGLVGTDPFERRLTMRKLLGVHLDDHFVDPVPGKLAHQFPKIVPKAPRRQSAAKSLPSRVGKRRSLRRVHLIFPEEGEAAFRVDGRPHRRCRRHLQAARGRIAARGVFVGWGVVTMPRRPYEAPSQREEHTPPR